MKRFEDRTHYIAWLINMFGMGYDLEAVAFETGGLSDETVVIDGKEYAAYYEMTATEEELAESLRRHSNEVTEDNFFLSTYADFVRWDGAPDREPDYESKSGSAYWYEDTYVVRRSDHWGAGIRSCDWYIDGGSYGYGMHVGGSDEFAPICGACRWDGFKRTA